ncbi:MAG: Gfo/Idh/MocA family oxidoreductase [Clostridium sp.]|nr:Gfo/Idh/MocA family oxidoreductase [Bacteroides sp.]MCM1197768.1 Gfo/Idh/MocA family oxidoreductase [Clostridium sp.]
MDRIKVGVIGFGRMGEMYLNEMRDSGKWDIVYICDIFPEARMVAERKFPGVKVVESEDIIFNDPEIQAVGLFALADSRKGQIEKAIAAGKHFITEKPIAGTVGEENELVALMEHSDVISTVNLYLRNSWYHKAMKEFIASGEIGELAIIRICHMTPGLAPGEGHEYEGPAFHDCGMHYVDIARWYAGSEYSTWHSQAVRMWDYKDPWWLQVHGTFDNGVVYDITQGFVYGQLSKDQTHNSYVDIIGTKGIVRMTHDFKKAVVEMRGVTRTEIVEKPFGGKNIDVLCDLFADSVVSGVRNPSLPELKDAAISSAYAWKFLDNALDNVLPSIGDNETLEAIRERRRNMTDGYGLLPRPRK